MVAAFFKRLLQADEVSGGSAQRMSGPPTSSNGASSMHLAWEVPPVPLSEVSVDLEILEPPVVAKLYFWALQVNFVTSSGIDRGGAHTGLQYHPSYPDGGAVNWGGYHPSGGGELDGSTSELPSALNNINTRDYRWQPERPYRLRVFLAEPGRWRATATDTATGAESVIRDLSVDAEHLVRPMVWSEVFADCDHPAVTIRWSNLRAKPSNGGEVSALSVRTNYQSNADGGCANTSSTVDGSGRGFLQQTNVARAAGAGTILTLPKG